MVHRRHEGVPAAGGDPRYCFAIRRYYFSVTQIRSMGSLPILPDSWPSLKSIVGIQPTPPSGEGLG
jgi:hypothetical protein